MASGCGENTASDIDGREDAVNIEETVLMAAAVVKPDDLSSGVDA